MASISSNTAFIKRKAKELGFFYCGISKAEFLKDQAPRLETWLKNGLHGTMAYMENYFDKRLDPTKLVPGAKSVVSLLLNYFPTESIDNSGFKLSKYAYGEDYHTIVKDKLKDLMNALIHAIGEVNGRIFVDSAPVMDKVWAAKSGLGWMGKNTNLIHPKEGSFFFIAELIIDIELEYDGPMKDYCGSCTRCIDACPTDALKPYKIDASRCISYLTIELKDAILPSEFKERMDNWMFGCDICQDVCPWNRFSKPHNESRLNANEKLKGMSDCEWVELTSDIFDELFKGSAVQRTKFSGLERNIKFLTN